MITLGWYLFKVIICSGILTAYYFLALRNKAFHRWNRFYLLATVVVSLIVPVMKINIFHPGEEKGTVVQMLQTISYGDEAVVEYSRNNSFQLSTQTMTAGIYLLFVLIFLFVFFHSLYRINKLKTKNPKTYFDDISFINTNAKGTPFSFFKNIFWNDAIELQSKTGQHIFQHELAHIKEKHSYDKVMMNIVLIFFWINPFFWLLRKELYMIHEFIADKESIEDSDISAFAEMVLQSVYPGQNFSLANNFFYSPLKRRLLMLIKNKNPKVSYINRLLVLPVAAIVFFGFTLKIKNKSTNLYNGKTITVVIDAGHGGDDNGAVSDDGVKEKDITLSIAKRIAKLNSNSHIQVVLSRTADYSLSVKDRVEFAKSNNADVFISLHVNAAADKQLKGFSVLIDKDNGKQNLLLASALINELKKSYNTQSKVGARTNGVWVLDHNNCTSALVEFGYLSNDSDEALITNSVNQNKIAKDVLESINEYASSRENPSTGSQPSLKNSSSIRTDTIPSGLPPQYFESKALFVINGKVSSNQKAKELDPKRIESIYILKGQKATHKYGEKGENGVIEISTIPENTLIIIDGKESSKDDLNKIPPAKIESVRVFKGESAVKRFGVKAKDGAISVITKKNPTNSSGKDSIPDKVFNKVEKEASFPGGQQAWQKYIAKAIIDSISKFTKADYGTCVVKFIVNVDGSVSDVVATTMKGTQLAKVSVNAIKNGPKWIPASQNGKTVAAYRLQPVTLKSAEKKPDPTSSATKEDADKGKPMAVFTKLEKPASFPGGSAAWLKYITRVIQKNANELTGDKNSQGRCEVRFMVSKDGRVSDVQAITKQDSKLADVAVNAIENGPRWIPGMQNGHQVNSLVVRPVTFFLNDQNDRIFMEPK